MRFVTSTDDAWDVDRVDDETLDKDGNRLDGADDHPFWVYFTGKTRYDLDDERLQPYLDRSKNPEIWTIRRLGWQQRRRVDAMIRKGQLEEAWEFALLHGVVSLEGIEDDDEKGQALVKVIEELPKVRTPSHRIALLEAAYDYAAECIDDVGSAVHQASMDLQEAEGKPSASPPGD